MDELATYGLKSWRNLNAVITKLKRPQVEAMLAHEKEHGQRTTFVVRLTQRLSQIANEENNETTLQWMLNVARMEAMK